MAELPAPPPRRKVVSPYDLFPGDSPGVSITPVLLHGENYEEWSRAIRGALRARRKYGFVDGTLKQPTNNPAELEDWWQVSSLVASWVYNSICDDVRKTVTYKENAREMWVDLEQRFNLTNGPRVHRIKKEIADCRQNGESVMAYFGRIKKIWDDLATVQQTPTCACSGCECGLTAKLDVTKEEEKLHQFLMGLDDVVYKTVRSNILGLDPLPSVNQAYQRVIQEEQLTDITRDNENHVEAVGFSVQTPSFTPKPAAPLASGKPFLPSSDLTCTFCKREVHDVSHCFHLVGFPEWWYDRSKGRGRGQGAKPSNHPRAPPACAHVANAEPGVSVQPPSVPPGVTPEQWRAVLHALQSTSDSSSETLSGPKYQDGDWSR